MAEDSKKERRDAAREARRIAQEEAAKAAAKARVRSIFITIVSLVVIGGLVWLAVDNVRTKEVDAAIIISRDTVAAAQEAAGCEVLALDTPEAGAADHRDPATAPPADVMYPFEIRPAHSGPHFGSTLPLIRAGASSQLDERGMLHNLEHGSIQIAYDPEQVDGDDIAEMEDLSATLNDSGFGLARSGSGIFVAPYTEPGISSGKAVAFRAWGNAVDCDTWDDDVAYGFIREHYGTAGTAPEGNFATYPIAVLAYDDEAANAPTDGATEPADLGTMAPADDSTATDEASEAATDEPSEAATDEPSEATTDTATDEPTDEPTPTESASEAS